MAFINEYLLYTPDSSFPCGYTLCRDCAADFGTDDEGELAFDMAAEDDAECEFCGATQEDE